MPICIHPQFVIILTGKVLPSHPEHRIAIGTRGTSAPTMPLSLPSIQVETASCKPTGLSKRSANSKSLVIAERSGHFFSVFFHGPATTISSTFRCGNVKYQLSIIKSLATRNKCLVRGKVSITSFVMKPAANTAHAGESICVSFGPCIVELLSQLTLTN